MIVLVTIGNTSKRQYAYNTDLDLQIGEEVTVPLGKENRPMTAVVSSLTPTADEAAWASKKIIGRV